MPKGLSDRNSTHSKWSQPNYEPIHAVTNDTDMKGHHFVVPPASPKVGTRTALRGSYGLNEGFCEPVFIHRNDGETFVHLSGNLPGAPIVHCYNRYPGANGFGHDHGESFSTTGSYERRGVIELTRWIIGPAGPDHSLFFGGNPHRIALERIPDDSKLKVGDGSPSVPPGVD